jgi:hypothetical protein
MASKRQPSINQGDGNRPNQASSGEDARPGAAGHPATANNILIWVQRSNLAKVSPGLVRAIPPTVEVGRQNTSLWRSLWSLIWESILEGFALYGASIHPAAFLAVKYDATEQPIDAPNDSSPEPRGRSGTIHYASADRRRPQ